MTTKKKDTRTEVPKDHPIAGCFPHELDLRFALRLDRVSVTDRFSSDDGHTRHLRVVYDLVRDGVRDSNVRLEAEGLIEGITFGPDGKPDDPAKWGALVKETLDIILEDGASRIHDLIEMGREAENASDDDAAERS